MRIKNIRLKNIRSYEDEEISFPEGKVLLSGDIGSGKTSILLAIEYALFGLQPGQKGAALLRHNKDYAEVVLELEIEGKQVLIERAIKRTNKSVNSDYAAITINGVKEESSVSEVKSKVLELLNYPFEFVKKNNLLYRYTVYTPQEEMKAIIQEDSESRLNILRHIFGIDKYKRIRENIQIVLANLKDDAKILALEIRQLDDKKSALSLSKEYLQTLYAKINEGEKNIALKIKERKQIELESIELETKIKERDNFEKEIEKSAILIASKKENFFGIVKEISETEKKIEKSASFSEEELKNVLQLIKSKKDNVESLSKAYMELTGGINSFNAKREENLNKKSRVFNMHFCPTCLQDVSEDHKHNIMNQTEQDILSIGKSILDLEQKRKDAKISVEKEKAILEDLEEQKVKLEIAKSKAKDIDTANSRITDLLKLKDYLQKDILLLSKHIDSLKQSVLEFSKYNTLFKTNQESLKKAFLEEKKAEIALAEFKKEMELKTKEAGNLEKEISEKETAKNKLIALTELSDWISSNFLNLINYTERSIMIKLRQEFSKLFSKWFYMLTQDSFEVHLDENFTPVIIQQGIETDYSFLSGGERTAVALAYRLALNQTINSILSKIRTKDIVILDEPTDGFSDQQLDRMRDILNELNAAQLIIVSHEQKIESFVDHVIKLRKLQGLSHKDA